MANRIRGPGSSLHGTRAGTRQISGPGVTTKGEGVTTHHRATDRWRANTDATMFTRAISSLSDSHKPLAVKVSGVAGTVVTFELDLSLLPPSAHPVGLVRTFELDLSLLPPLAVLPITGTVVTFELDLSLLPPTALGQPVTGTVLTFEFDLSLVPPTALVLLAPRALTAGRLYPLPPGNRVHPVLPTGRNVEIG